MTTMSVSYKLNMGIGIGGFGLVHKATENTGRIVALKQARAPLRVQRTLLQHEARDIPRYRPCSTLKEKWPGSVTRIPMKTIVPVMQQLLSALAHVHKLGFIHRDIKPENVICSLDDPSRIKLIDFNLAKPISAGPPSKYDPISESKTIMGTVHWASLNSMHGIELSPRDDLESLAYVGLFLVRADLPWRNGPRDQTIKRSIKRVRDLKAKWTGAELGAGCDPEFGDLLDYSRGLSFYCLPDYDMWNSRFTDLAVRSGVVPGEPLDWTPEALPASIPQLSVSCEAVDFDPALMYWINGHLDSSQSNPVTLAAT